MPDSSYDWKGYAPHVVNGAAAGQRTFTPPFPAFEAGDIRVIVGGVATTNYNLAWTTGENGDRPSGFTVSLTLAAAANVQVDLFGLAARNESDFAATNFINGAAINDELTRAHAAAAVLAYHQNAGHATNAQTHSETAQDAAEAAAADRARAETAADTATEKADEAAASQVAAAIAAGAAERFRTEASTSARNAAASAETAAQGIHIPPPQFTGLEKRRLTELSGRVVETPDNSHPIETDSAVQLYYSTEIDGAKTALPVRADIPAAALSRTVYLWARRADLAALADNENVRFVITAESGRVHETTFDLRALVGDRDDSEYVHPGFRGSYTRYRFVHSRTQINSRLLTGDFTPSLPGSILADSSVGKGKLAADARVAAWAAEGQPEPAGGGGLTPEQSAAITANTAGVARNAAAVSALQNAAAPADARRLLSLIDLEEHDTSQTAWRAAEGVRANNYVRTFAAFWGQNQWDEANNRAADADFWGLQAHLAIGGLDFQHNRFYQDDDHNNPFFGTDIFAALYQAPGRFHRTDPNAQFWYGPGLWQQVIGFQYDITAFPVNQAGENLDFDVLKIGTAHPLIQGNRERGLWANKRRADGTYYRSEQLSSGHTHDSNDIYDPQNDPSDQADRQNWGVVIPYTTTANDNAVDPILSLAIIVDGALYRVDTNRTASDMGFHANDGGISDWHSGTGGLIVGNYNSFTAGVQNMQYVLPPNAAEIAILRAHGNELGMGLYVNETNVAHHRTLTLDARLKVQDADGNEVFAGGGGGGEAPVSVVEIVSSGNNLYTLPDGVDVFHVDMRISLDNEPSGIDDSAEFDVTVKVDDITPASGLRRLFISDTHNPQMNDWERMVGVGVQWHDQANRVVDISPVNSEVTIAEVYYETGGKGDKGDKGDPGGDFGDNLLPANGGEITSTSSIGGANTRTIPGLDAAGEVRILVEASDGSRRQPPYTTKTRKAAANGHFTQVYYQLQARNYAAGFSFPGNNQIRADYLLNAKIVGVLLKP